MHAAAEACGAHAVSHKTAATAEVKGAAADGARVVNGVVGDALSQSLGKAQGLLEHMMVTNGTVRHCVYFQLPEPSLTSDSAVLFTTPNFPLYFS